MVKNRGDTYPGGYAAMTTAKIAIGREFMIEPAAEGVLSWQRKDQHVTTTWGQQNKGSVSSYADVAQKGEYPMQKGRTTLHIGDPNAFEIPTAQRVADESFASTKTTCSVDGGSAQIDMIIA